MSCDYNRPQVVATFHAWAPDGTLLGTVRVARLEGNWHISATGNVPTVPAVMALWGDRTAAYLYAQEHVRSFEAGFETNSLPVQSDPRAFDVVAAPGYFDDNSGQWVELP